MDTKQRIYLDILVPEGLVVARGTDPPLIL